MHLLPPDQFIVLETEAMLVRSYFVHTLLVVSLMRMHVHVCLLQQIMCCDAIVCSYNDLVSLHVVSLGLVALYSVKLLQLSHVNVNAGDCYICTLTLTVCLILLLKKVALTKLDKDMVPG